MFSINMMQTAVRWDNVSFITVLFLLPILLQLFLFIIYDDFCLVWTNLLIRITDMIYEFHTVLYTYTVIEVSYSFKSSSNQKYIKSFSWKAI